MMGGFLELWKCWLEQFRKMLDKINDSPCIRCLKSQRGESYGVYGRLGEAGDVNLLRIMRQK